jgi:hypothetical protein
MWRKGLVEQREQPHGRLRDNRGRSPPGQQQTDLAADFAAAERRNDVPVLLDERGPLEDGEQLIGELTLTDDALARRNGDLVERVGQGRLRPRGQGCEAGHGLDEGKLDHASKLLWHATGVRVRDEVVTSRSPHGHIRRET